MGRFGNIYPYGKHKPGTLQHTDEIKLPWSKRREPKTKS